MSSLYNLNEAINNFEFHFDDVTGEVTNMNDFEDLLEAQGNKREDYCLFIKQLKHEIEALEAEKKIFEERIKSKKRLVESLTKGLVISLNGQPFETTRCKVTFRKSTSVEIEDEEQFMQWCQATDHQDLVKIKLSHSFDKLAIKELINEKPDSVEYARIVEKQNIQIK